MSCLLLAGGNSAAQTAEQASQKTARASGAAGCACSCGRTTGEAASYTTKYATDQAGHCTNSIADQASDCATCCTCGSTDRDATADGATNSAASCAAQATDKTGDAAENAADQVARAAGACRAARIATSGNSACDAPNQTCDRTQHTAYQAACTGRSIGAAGDIAKHAAQQTAVSTCTCGYACDNPAQARYSLSNSGDYAAQRRNNGYTCTGHCSSHMVDNAAYGAQKAVDGLSQASGLNQVLGRTQNGA